MAHATPPFAIDESKPADSDIVSQHPTTARDVRDNIEAWMDFEHGMASGRHKIPAGTIAARDAITDWEKGSFWINTDATPDALQMNTGTKATPIWLDVSETAAFALVDDTTPQLGGDLDLNGKNIDFPTTANISDCLDEDDMASNAADKLVTQQSVKAHVAAAIAALVTGKLLQTQSTVDTTNRSTTSTSYVASSVSVVITPASTSNTVRIRVHAMVGTSAAGGQVFLTLKRGSTFLTPSGTNSFAGGRFGGGNDIDSLTFEFEDSPSSASAVTYEIWWRVDSGTGRLGRRHSDTDFDCPTIIVAEEIGA